MRIPAFFSTRQEASDQRRRMDLWVVLLLLFLSSSLWHFLRDVAQNSSLRGFSPIPLVVADIAGTSLYCAVALVIARREREISQPRIWVELAVVLAIGLPLKRLIIGHW